MRKGLHFTDHFATNKNKLFDEIENTKRHLIDKRHAYWIKLDNFLKEYHFYGYGFNFQNFRNFWEYERFLKKNKNYERDFKLFLRYKKQNLSGYYHNGQFINF